MLIIGYLIWAHVIFLAKKLIILFEIGYKTQAYMERLPVAAIPATRAGRASTAADV